MIAINQRIPMILICLVYVVAVGGSACQITSNNPISSKGQETALPAASATVENVPKPTSTSATLDEFLRVEGQALEYKGQTVYLRGTNFNNYLALKIRTDTLNWGDGKTDDINYSEADYEKLSQLGGNHVRWGISFNWYKDNRDNFFEVLDQHIVWARKYNVWLVPLLFTFPDDCYEGYTYQCPYWSDVRLQQEVLDFWVDVARHYRDEPVIAGYDILNEPTPGPTGLSTWFALAQEIRDAISQVDPHHLVFIEFDSSGKTLPLFEGNNIVYSTHIYSPLAITHAEGPTNLTYPGLVPDNNSLTWWDKESMAGGNQISTNLKTKYGIEWAEKYDLPLYVGEFGTRAWVDGSLKYLDDIFDLLNSWNLHYAHFVWRANTYEGFGIYPAKDSLLPWSEDREALIAEKLAGSFKPDFSGTILDH
jgi:hypothetical protein